HKLETGNQRLKRFAILLKRSRGESPERAAVKSIVQGKYAEFLVPVGGVPARKRAGELEAAFDGFGSAVGEERAIESGELAQLLCKTALVFVVEQIRDVQ